MEPLDQRLSLSCRAGHGVSPCEISRTPQGWSSTACRFNMAERFPYTFSETGEVILQILLSCFFSPLCPLIGCVHKKEKIFPTVRTAWERPRQVVCFKGFYSLSMLHAIQTSMLPCKAMHNDGSTSSYCLTKSSANVSSNLFSHLQWTLCRVFVAFEMCLVGSII